jgi:membrane-associated phospholipid phosphatase
MLSLLSKSGFPSKGLALALHDEKSVQQGVPGELRQDRFVGAQDLARWNTRAGHSFATMISRLSRALGPHAALILTLFAGGVLAVSLTAVFAQVYESVVESDGVAGLDHPVLDAAKVVRSPWLDTAATVYTDIGGTVGMPLLATMTLVVLAAKRRSWTPVILIVVAGVGSLMMTIAGKQLVGRTRPDLADAIPPYEYSASFPSGHSLNSIVIAGIVAYLIILRRKTVRARVLVGGSAVIFAATMGLSRVYLGHHWLTDVLGAWALGAAWLALVITAHRLYLTARSRQSKDAPGPQVAGRAADSTS